METNCFDACIQLVEAYDKIHCHLAQLGYPNVKDEVVAEMAIVAFEATFNTPTLYQVVEDHHN